VIRVDEIEDIPEQDDLKLALPGVRQVSGEVLKHAREGCRRQAEVRHAAVAEVQVADGD
jgi:hypothetical protein